ncbi:MAG: response regulator receiver protein [Caulobacter sp.]|nr:response regulator receiver protein [Caulobacter sp.]
MRLKTCLVVDDSRVIRKVARRILEEIGYEVAEAGDGVDALAWCRAAMPDAILLDWNMPAMNGIDFLRVLRQEPGGQAPVVVFCTVENDIDRIREALDAGASEYIMKPFDGDIIEAKFAQAGLA